MRGPYIILGLFLAAAGMVVQHIGTQPRPQPAGAPAEPIAGLTGAGIIASDVPSTPEATTDFGNNSKGLVVNNATSNMGNGMTIYGPASTGPFIAMDVFANLPADSSTATVTYTQGPLITVNAEIAGDGILLNRMFEPAVHLEMTNVAGLSVVVDPVNVSIPVGQKNWTAHDQTVAPQVAPTKSIKIIPNESEKSPFRLLETQFGRPCKLLDTQFKDARTFVVPYRAPSGN